MPENQPPEPWLRGTLKEVDPVRRQVLHALELAEEDCTQWASRLTPAELDLRPLAMASVAFHLRHIARSLDRLLTYAEDSPLSQAQHTALQSEMTGDDPLGELQKGIAQSKPRILALPPATFDQFRGVGRASLPSTVAGLIIHCAEHTQRHVGQVVTTAQVVIALRHPGHPG